MDVLRVEYDVTGLRQDEIDYLAGEATAQGESSEGHPGVPCTATIDRGVLLNDAVVAAALAELDAYGASDRDVSQLTKLEARSLAHAVRRLGGCTGYLDAGRLMHDGDTCPVHEDDPPEVVVHLSGHHVIGIDADGAVRAEVRQHHADHMDGLGAEGEDGHGRYEVVAMVAAVSAAAPVTAGPPPGPQEPTDA